MANAKEEKAKVDEKLSDKPAYKPRLKKQLATYVPFVRWYPGMVIYGEIVRVFSHTSTYGDKTNVEVKLKDEVNFFDSDGVSVELKPGDHINIGETGMLKTLMTLLPGTTIEVFCKGKEKTPRGDAWDFDVFYD